MTTHYKIASVTSVLAALRTPQGIDEHLVESVIASKVPEALTKHPNAPNWLLTWYYLGERHYGASRRAQIVEIINIGRLNFHQPNEFLAGIDNFQKW